MLEKKRAAITVETDTKLKLENALIRHIRDMRIPLAIEAGMFSEASWALDVAKKESYIILYTSLERHARLVNFLNARAPAGTLIIVKFDGLVLQFTARQVLLFGEFDDQVLIDWVKENHIKVNIGMCAEAAENHKKKYNQLMASIRTFADQDGTEDRREEARKVLYPEVKKDTEGEARTLGEEYDDQKWGGKWDGKSRYDPDQGPMD
jgi:hypothetical protein